MRNVFVSVLLLRRVRSVRAQSRGHPNLITPRRRAYVLPHSLFLQQVKHAILLSLLQLNNNVFHLNNLLVRYV